MINKILLLTLLIPLITSCRSSGEEKSSEESQEVITLVGIAEFHELLKQKDLQVVDVRTPKEYDLGKIPGAINIDYWAGDFAIQASHLDKDKPVAVYCAAGRRSAKAASKLKEMGFNRIYDLDGGMRAWHTGPPLAH